MFKKLTKNINTTAVVSTAVGVALFGAITYFAKRSNVPAINRAATVATGG